MNSELWIVRGVYWVIPISVTWQNDIAKVRTAIPLMNLQWAALEPVLDQFALRCRGNAQWFFSRDGLNSIACETELTDPEECLKWNPHPVQQTAQVKKKDCDPLLSRLVDIGLFVTIEAADIVWTMICQVILDFIVNEHISVDLKFAELAAFPYRCNWKEIAYDLDREERYPSVGHMLLDDRLNSFSRRGPKKGTFRWMLDIRPNALWRRMIEKREREREKILGFDVYVRGYRGDVKRCLPNAIAAFKTYHEEIRTPFLSFDIRQYSNGTTHRSTKGVSKYYSPRYLPVPIPIWRHVETRMPKFRVGSKVKFVPQVPPVQPASEDLRDAGTDMDEPRSDGTTGVPVLHADSGEDPKQDLLPS